MGISLSSAQPSLRTRLMLLLAAGLTVLLAVAAWQLYGALRDRATTSFDTGLRTRAAAILALTEQEGGQVEFDSAASAQWTTEPVRVEISDDALVTLSPV